MVTKFKNNPIDKIHITQGFGANYEMYKRYGLRGHNGLDFRTRFLDSPLGRREIFAVDDGVVTTVVVAKYGGYGTYVQIEHADGGVTLYGHQYRPLVTKGQRVSAGTVIGITDNTGNSTGPHLHFGYRPKNANMANGFKGYVDPKPYLYL